MSPYLKSSHQRTGNKLTDLKASRNGWTQLDEAQYNANPMREWLHSWRPAIVNFLKYLFGAAIIFAIGRRFAMDLSGHTELFSLPFRPGWLVVSGVLYLLGLGFSAFYWHRLLYRLGERPSKVGTVRAYYASQLGKYLPGKAWALFLRAAFARATGVRTGVAVASSFYEVLTTMSAGALLASVFFVWAAVTVPPGTAGIDCRPLAQLVTGRATAETLLNPAAPAILALVLLVLVGIPVLPPIINRIVFRVAKPFRRGDSPPLPRFDVTALVEGLVLTCGSWFLLSASLRATLCGVLMEPPTWSWSSWWHSTASVGLAYVAGFVILVVPGGLGVRELLLSPFVVSEIARAPGVDEDKARALAVLAVIVLRMIWTAAEVVMAGIVYCLPVSGRDSSTADVRAPLIQGEGAPE